MTVRTPDDIIYEIRELENFISNKLAVNCKFGKEDLKPEQYPYIQITVEEDIPIQNRTTKMSTIVMPVYLRIIVSRDNELRALDVYQRLIKKIHQFNKYSGHELEDTATPEYSDNTYEITVPLNIRLTIQDTEV